MNTPSDKPKRKNNPQKLRHHLLICAKDLMLKDGIAHLSLQKVADMAGTSKGGLFHHFKNKDELIEGVFELFIAQINTAIMTHINDEFGTFTKAYVRVFFDDAQIGLMSDWAGLIQAMTADNRLYKLWTNWLNHKLSIHADTDSDVRLAVIRHATDGTWLNKDGISDDELMDIKAYLLRLIDDITPK